jgi:DeoR/GlpR family transcriptional regulator of sugar metabolism
MKNFNVDKAVIGAGGITENGVTDFIIEEASLRSQIIKNAREVIVVCDYSKFNIRAMCNVCDIEDIDVLVTDSKAPKTVLEKIRKKGVKVIVVK